MEKSNHTSKMSKFVKSLKGTLIRQKSTGKEAKAATSTSHQVTLPPVNVKPSYSRNDIPLPLPPVADTICQLPYYHPHLTSKDDLTNFMSQYNLQEGYFLLRKSFNDQNSYTITVNHRTGLKHIRVDVSNGRFSLKDQSFETIDEMIQFYSHREIPNEDNISAVLLKFPIRRPPVEFGDYIVVSNGDGKQGTPIPQVHNPNLEGIWKPGYVGDRPQPPTPRPPVPLPRGDGYLTASRKDSLNDSSITPTTLRKVSTTPSVNDPIPSKPTGPPSANNLMLSIPIGPSAQRVGHLNTQLDVSQDERCDCGLLLREASLPLGWSVHISQDSDTKDQPFFQSPSNQTYWDLPLSVALHLSTEQQELIRNHGFDSYRKAGDFKALDAGRLITRPGGCPSRRWEGATWVSCGDYESLKEARQRPDGSSSCLQNALSGDSENPMRSEHTANTDSEYPNTHKEDVKDKKADILDDCAAKFATDDKPFPVV